MINRIKIKQIDTQCYVASQTGGCIVASDQLTTASLFLKAVIKIMLIVNIKKSLKIPKGGNHNPYIEDEQTIQWPKEKGQKDKQRSTKHTHKTKDRVTRTPLKT